MKKVHTIISDENIWVNIQKTDYPVLMSFDPDIVFGLAEGWPAGPTGWCEKAEA